MSVDPSVRHRRSGCWWYSVDETAEAGRACSREWATARSGKHAPREAVCKRVLEEVEWIVPGLHE